MRKLVAAIVLLVLSAAVAAQPPADGPSFVNEGVIAAPISEVWRVWSTSDGYKRLGVALAAVDLRVGGLIRSRYAADGVLGDEQTIENEILAYEPPRMSVFPNVAGQSASGHGAGMIGWPAASDWPRQS